MLFTSASADLDPAWVARLPVGSSLSAGISGMVVDPAGVSYVTGITGPSSNTDVITAAFGPDGALLWSQTYNGPQDWHDQARGIALGPGDTLYVVGNTPGNGFYASVLVLKYDRATGTLLDTIQYTSAPFTAEHGAAVAADDQGNVFVAGGTVGDGPDVLVLAFGPTGEFRWSRTWDGPAASPYSQDSALQIRLDPAGDPVVMIHGVMNTLHPDYVVIKYDSDGATVWEATWGVAGGDFANDMEIDAAGDVYVTGTGLDFIDKLSTIKLRGTDGQLLWQAYDTDGFDDHGTALTLADGAVFITGTVDPDGDRSNFNDDIYTVKRDAISGALQWTQRYGASCVGCLDVPSDVLVDPSGNVFVAGSTSSPPYNGDVITLVLDQATGSETDRGIVPGGTNESAGSGVLRFDASFDLYNGGQIYNVNTGARDISVFRYDALAHSTYRLAVSDLVAGNAGTFRVENGTPDRWQFFLFSLQGPGSIPFPALGVTLGLQAPNLLGYGRADAAGVFELTRTVPLGAAGASVWFQTFEVGATTDVVATTVQ